MTKRELELAKRHRSELVDARDRAWQALYREGADTARGMRRHDALVFALKCVEDVIAAAERPAELAKTA